MLSYLQLISNPSYSPALARVLNVPRRGIGDKTQAHIFDVAAQKGISAFEICVRIAKGQNAVSGVTGAQKKGIKALVEVVRDARKKADEVRLSRDTSVHRHVFEADACLTGN